ncbi:hypothetical protein [Thiosocius teredinicola]|uniref:hypothetical protein n=1 Tax=Thiosocius teredinicola TaxID=1973002 RepID=UPI00099110F8
MKALLIDPEHQTITQTEVSDIDDVKALIGFDTIESDAIGDQGDRLFFDEECFIRGTSGRFQIDSVIPVAGKGVIVGVLDDGSLSDVKTSLADLTDRLKYQ